MSPKDRILDLGGGKGDLSKALIRQLGGIRRIVCVDPNPLLLSRIRSKEIRTEVGDAIGFLSACESGSFDSIIMKQVVHHILPEQREALYSQLNRVVSPKGKVAILTMPPTILYPMFTAAIRKFERDQIDHGEVIDGLMAAGFSARTVPGDYPVRISWDRYSNAVRERFISDLRSFTPAQIERGLLETKRRLGNLKTLSFHDRLVTFIGTKPQ